MEKKIIKHIGGALCAVGMLAATTASAQSFFFNYGHTPIYTEFDGNVTADLYANSFEFGTYIDDGMRAGVYHEQLSGAVSANIQGISVEYEALATGDLMSNLGLMVGSGRDNTANTTSLIADVYGRVALVSSEATNINAKLAYRHAPDSGFAGSVGGAGSDLHGLYMNIGFGIHF